MNDDRGSTLPLILGFVVIALLLVAGSVAAGDAFIQQRGLQDMCDGAAADAAASAIDLQRAHDIEPGQGLTFVDVRRATAAYRAREPSRADVTIRPALSDGGRTLTLTCFEKRPVAFGAMFGYGDGVSHTARSSARAPLSG